MNYKVFPERINVYQDSYLLSGDLVQALMVCDEKSQEDLEDSVEYLRVDVVEKTIREDRIKELVKELRP